MIPLHTIELVEGIRLTGKPISKQENGFLATMMIQAKANRLISDRQSKWLQDIYDRVHREEGK